MDIILSDVEGTLTTGSSWRSMRRYFRANFDSKVYDRFFLGWAPRYLLVKCGLMSKRAAMMDWMRDEISLFKGLSVVEFEKMATWIVETDMWPKRRTRILAELGRYQQQGVQIVVVSSAYQPIVDAFAQRMDAIPIGTPLVFNDDLLSGFTPPVNAYEQKAEYIRTHFPEFQILSAYGDTASDIPMMEMSQEPVAVNPDAELRQVANSKGWRIVVDE